MYRAGTPVAVTRGEPRVTERQCTTRVPGAETRDESRVTTETLFIWEGQ